jgi:hypothetical protein
MMKKITLLIFSFICLSSQAQQWLWGKNGSGSGDDKAHSVSADASGNVFVTGEFSSPTITFGSTVLTNSITGGGDNVFIAKYDPYGNVLWAKHAGGNNNSSGTSVSADASGNVFVTGEFASSTITFGSTTLTNSDAGSGDIFIVKYSAAGNILWAKQVGGGTNVYGNDGGLAVSADAGGNVFVTGYFGSPTITIGTYVLNNLSTTSYGTNIFIAKYDANGNVLWAKSAGGTGDYQSNSVTTSMGNVYVTGSFLGSTMTFDSTTISYAGGWDGFIAKYDVNGNVLWAKSVGGTSSDYCSSGSADANGNMFVTGWFGDSTITFDSIALYNSGTVYPVFIVKYDANGNALWAKSAVGGIYTQSYSISADVNGNAFVTGYFQSPPITFDSVTLTPPPANCSYNSSPSCDPMFIVKYDSNGNVLCASSLASGNGSSVSADHFGNAYVGGWFAVNPFIVNTDTLPFAGTQNVFVGKFSSGNNVAVNELSKRKSISVYPNPSSGKFIVQMYNCQAGAKVTVRDILGNCLFEKNCQGESNQEINLSCQSKGIYFLEMVSDGERVVKKMILE